MAFRLWSGSGNFVSVNKIEKKLIVVVDVRWLSLAVVGLRGCRGPALACVSSDGGGGGGVVYSGST